MNRKIISGVPISPGIAIGPAFVSDSAAIKIPVFYIHKDQIENELKRFEKAVATAKEQIESMIQEMEIKLGSKDAMIFRVHSQILEDSNFIGKVEEKIREEKINVEAALREVITWYSAQIAAVHSSTAKDISADIRDAGNRVIRILMAHEKDNIIKREEQFVLVTHELLPSDTVHLDKTKLLGIVTEVGGKASHAAILSRSFGIPAITGVDISVFPATVGEVVLDGRKGAVILYPNGADTARYEERRKEFRHFKDTIYVKEEGEAVTQDGTEIELLANIENFDALYNEDFENVRGIGLYRTEFLFMDRNTFPSEDEQYEIYRSILQSTGPDKEVTFRTIDIGGDKKLPYFRTPEEANPVLGWRGVRISFEWPDIFIAQARALLRTGAHGQVNIMLPMVTDLEEVRTANRYFADIKGDLRKRGTPFGESTRLGIMVEVPAAAMDIDNIVHETDFVSIGSNDLIQYVLAVDRNNAKVAEMYQPLNPAILKIIHRVIRAGQNNGKKVSICGEMAGNFNYTQLLLGMGLRRFSMAPFYFSGVKKVIRNTTIADCERIAGRALNMRTMKEIRTYLKRMNFLSPPRGGKTF
jgi:phosphoenolpyruvate-protein phosphotransferase (PTS system enzyme I)